MTLSRSSSSANMFSMLSQVSDVAENSSTATKPMRGQNLPSNSVESATCVGLILEEAGPGRAKLELLPRDGLTVQSPNIETPAPDIEVPHVDIVNSIDQRLDQDVLEFFAIRNLVEGEAYFTSLPPEHQSLLVEKIVKAAVESGRQDAILVSALFARLSEKRICSMEDFGKGFMRVTEYLDDLSIDVPRAVEWMATMLKGVPFSLAHLQAIVQGSTAQTQLLKLVMS